VAKNTNLDNADFGSNLQPVQKVVDPKAENYNWIGGSNGPYVKALLKLQVPVEQLSNIPASKRDADPTAGTAQNAAASAKLAVRALAQQFRPDPVDKTDQTVVHLLEAPIVSVELLIRNANLSAVNARGGQLCSEMRKVIDKYPFNPKGEKASLADLSNFFRRPDGLLWQFYAANLTTLLGEHKGIFSPKPNAPMAVRPLFVRSFNNMAAVSTYLTRGGTIRFPFSVQEFQGGGLKTIKLLIGGQGGTISSAPRQFSWPGDPNRGVEWTLGDSPTFPQEYPGFWGVFDWFNSATWESKSLDSFIVTWSLTLGGKPLPGTDGQPLKARLEVHMPIPLFQNGYLHALSCSGDIVQPGS
jgi:type VI protein secretion system component VasK